MSAIRTLTILVTDIVDSTGLFAGADGTHASRWVLTHLASIDREVTHHHGRTIKRLGDGVLASFVSATHAVECATAIQRTASRPMGGASAKPSMSIRVGISTGDTRYEDGDCYGLPVIEASRLCALASGGQILVAEGSRLAARPYAALTDLGPRALKGIPEDVRVWQADWSAEHTLAIRVVLADDAVLVREGIARALEAAGLDVVAQADDSEHLERLTSELLPDVVITDVRMPPSFTTEGLEAAARIRARHPSTAVIVLTQDPVATHSERLRRVSAAGIGYLLKERVHDLDVFAATVRRVAAGGTAFDDLDGPATPHRPMPHRV